MNDPWLPPDPASENRRGSALESVVLAVAALLAIGAAFCVAINLVTPDPSCDPPTECGFDEPELRAWAVVLTAAAVVALGLWGLLRSRRR